MKGLFGRLGIGRLTAVLALSAAMPSHPLAQCLREGRRQPKVSQATTNLPPFFTVYTAAVTGTDADRRWILEMPKRENVRGNSTFANTRRYLASRGFFSEEEIAQRRVYCTTNAARSALARAAAHPHPRLFDFGPLESLGGKAPGRVRLLADAESFLERPPVAYRMTGYRLLDIARCALTRLATLTVAARLTGDVRYVRRIECELDAVCSFVDWNPGHFLDTAEVALGVAFAYDGLYDRLSTAARSRCARALRTKAIDAAHVRGEWMTLRNNWVQVGAGGMAAALLALAEEGKPGDAALFSDVVNHLPEAERVVAPDGAFPEGPGYWHYGFTFNALAISMIETACGTDFALADVPGFRASGFFPALMTGPSGMFFNFSDSHTRRPTLPALAWFALKTGDERYLDAMEERRFAEYCAARGDDAESETKVARDFPFGLLWRAAWERRKDRRSSAVMRNDRTTVLGGEMPVGVQRSADGSAYVAIKGGSPSYNHGHADEGSFVLDAGGVRWAFDPGPENYSRVEAAIGGRFWAPEPDSPRWRLFRLGSQGHNTLLIGGRGQDSTGFATVTNVGEDVVVDLTGVYPQARSVTRRSRVDADGSGGSFVDEIEASPGTAVRWAMLTDAEVTVEGATARLRKRGLVLELAFSVMSASGASPVVTEARPEGDYESPNPGLRQICYDARAPGNSRLTLTVVWKLSGPGTTGTNRTTGT